MNIYDFTSELHNSSTELLPLATTLTSPTLSTLSVLSGFSIEQTANDLAKSVEELIARVEEKSVCIIKTDNELIGVGKALAYVFGEDGRTYFHKLSLTYNNLSPVVVNKIYDDCKSAILSEIQFGGIFELAHNEGIEASYLSSIENRIIRAGKVDNAYKAGNLEHFGKNASVFTDKITGKVPGILQFIIDNASSTREADILVIGALTAMSCCLPKITSTYDGIATYPNLFFFITAQASAGKGKLALCTRIVRKIDKELKDFDDDKTLFIPADSSATAFCQALKDNNEWGLLFDTEGDTLANSFGKDYSDFSAQLRKAFQNEPISLRRVSSGPLNVDEPKLSTLLTGTPEQVKNLFRDTENGLFSRFSFCILYAEVVWKNVYKSRNVDLNKLYDALGDRFYFIYQTLIREKELVFALTEQQEKIFNVVFEKIQYKASVKYGPNILGTVRRLALTTHRIAMVLTILRIEEDGDVTQPLRCRDEDFETAMTMALTIIEHDIEVFVKLFPNERKSNKYNKQIQSFFDGLPDEEFDRLKYLEVAKKLGIPDNTASKYIKKFKDNNDLTNTKYGFYIKTSEYDAAA